MYRRVRVNTVIAMYIPLKNAAPRVTRKPNMLNVSNPVRNGIMDAIVHHAVRDCAAAIQHASPPVNGTMYLSAATVLRNMP